MIEMSCEEHDRLAAQSQFVTHTIGRYTSFPTPLPGRNAEEELRWQYGLVKYVTLTGQKGQFTTFVTRNTFFPK